ncbi:hypothetical protein [Streptomyces hoynatensis]|uniref:Uncharacterized protein n=1 Tax=Streptomyces hoynatensis TaxID=1141874 RepID=A0A3A9YMU4_9ACTN|nr:hypothetical protein [Streptomyces hoynatensis]RKN35926.1 hypothetical protein D7294_30310 [Streptomyces hoynatensis]
MMEETGTAAQGMGLHHVHKNIRAELREALGAYDRAENAALRADAAVRVALWARTLLEADEL